MTYLDELPIESRIAEMKRLYQKVFRTPEGQIVFTDLLQTLFVFEAAKNPDEQVLRNFGTALMSQVLSTDSSSLVGAMLAVNTQGEV